MTTSPPTPPEVLYTESDQLHAAVVYRRPAGNTDIDNDPVPGAKMFGQSLGVRVFIDKMPNPPKLSPELIERLQSLNDQSKLHDTMKQYIHQ